MKPFDTLEVVQCAHALTTKWTLARQVRAHVDELESTVASRTQQHAKVTCTFDCPEPIALTDNLTATHLFLIAQEAVHNAIKHGKPRNIWIGLQSNHALVLRVQCNGMGMPVPPLATEGLGLRIMRDRAAIIGAHLTIEPAEPTGTVVTCTLVRSNNEREKEETSPSPDRR